jgi:pyruvate kinase
MLTRLLRAGMDVCRLNFSHGDHKEHARVIGLIRELTQNAGRPAAILQDLSGPKVRLGEFTVPVITLKKGQEVVFTAAKHQMSSQAEAKTCLTLPLPVPELLAALRPKNTLLLDDGRLMLRVTACQGEPFAPDRRIVTRCVVGGELKPRKGVTAPGVAFSVPAVTDKDRDDLRFGLRHGVDWIAASYVRNADDILPLREVMEEVGIRVPIIAKIEKWEAVQNLNKILAVVDGIMVARGDLGVEMPFDEVPLMQKQIIRACNRAGKPVITATQMLESMIGCPRPTRAEAADVANAILDGTDAVMLSGETAAGEYPVEAVRAMGQIAVRAEQALFADHDYVRRLAPPASVTQAVARAAVDIAETIDARMILCATTSGGTARSVAKYRPVVPIFAVTPSRAVYHQLALTWGVLPCLIAPVNDTDSMMRTTIAAALEKKMVREGDKVVLTAGVPINNKDSTNLIKVHVIGQPLEAAPETNW